MTETRLTNLIQNLPELKPSESVWKNIQARITPKPRVPTPWLTVGFAAAVMAVAAVPIINQQVEEQLPESVLALAEMVEESEQLKQELLFTNALLGESLPVERGLMYRVDALDQKAHANGNLSLEERQRLMQQQLDTLANLRYIQQENIASVRRVSL